MQALMTIVTLSFLCFGVQAKDILVKVNLSPAGSFEIKSKSIKGKIIRKGSELMTSGISVKVKKLKTGLELRDDHLHKKLGKSSKIEIVSAKASGGKGTAKIKIKGVTKSVPFKYTDKGKEVLIKFALSLAKFGIKGINYAGVGVKDKVTIRASLPVK
jgi:hypothetical protein